MISRLPHGYPLTEFNNRVEPRRPVRRDHRIERKGRLTGHRDKVLRKSLGFVWDLGVFNCPGDGGIEPCVLWKHRLYVATRTAIGRRGWKDNTVQWTANFNLASAVCAVQEDSTLSMESTYPRWGENYRELRIGIGEREPVNCCGVFFCGT